MKNIVTFIFNLNLVSSQVTLLTKSTHQKLLEILIRWIEAVWPLFIFSIWIVEYQYKQWNSVNINQSNIEEYFFFNQKLFLSVLFKALKIWQFATKILSNIVAFWEIKRTSTYYFTNLNFYFNLFKIYFAVFIYTLKWVHSLPIFLGYSALCKPIMTLDLLAFHITSFKFMRVWIFKQVI